MTLLDAEVFDEARARRRKAILGITVLVVVAVAILVWFNRYWPEEHIADKFFSALQKQDYETAYGLYYNDPGWKQHPEKYSKYPINEFRQDWGKGGPWGLIKTYKVHGASGCPGGGSGVVVDVIVNDRSEHAQLWIEKSDKTISSPPCDLLFP